MANFIPGLVHAPVTPFTRDYRVDYELYRKIIDFHLRNGAQALAVQMHSGESVSLTDMEQRRLIELAVKQVNGRVPVIAHVSDSGTAIAVARAHYAEEVGAAAIVATAPYYWTPPPSMLIEHLAQIGQAVSLPFLVLYSPDELTGVKLGTDTVMTLIKQLPNFSGVVDASLDWQFMINIVSNAWRVRPEFQLLSGTEYMVSAGAVGATSMFSSLAGIAPKLVRQLYEICRRENYFDARAPQEALAELRQIVKRAGPAGLKGAMRAMGRDCGEPRPPLDPLPAPAARKLAAALDALAPLRDEPRGW